MNPYYFFINGIYTSQNDVSAWPNQAVAWMHENRPGVPCETFMYNVGAMAGLLNDTGLGDILAKDVLEVAQDGFDPVIVAHSNGNRIVAKMLTNHTDIKNVRWQSVAAWLSSDCRVNGLNDAAQNGKIVQLTVYRSPVDEVLPTGELIAGDICGEVGKDGLRAASPALEAITREVVQQSTHCDWVGKNLYATLAMACPA